MLSAKGRGSCPRRPERRPERRLCCCARCPPSQATGPMPQQAPATAPCAPARGADVSSGLSCGRACSSGSVCSVSGRRPRHSRHRECTGASPAPSPSPVVTPWMFIITWSSVVISGHQRSSVVISGHQWSSVVISGHAMDVHQLLSVVINCYQWSRHGCSSSVVINCHQWSSIRKVSEKHMASRNGRSSVVINGHQSSSVVISGHQSEGHLTSPVAKPPRHECSLTASSSGA